MDQYGCSYVVSNPCVGLKSADPDVVAPIRAGLLSISPKQTILEGIELMKSRNIHRLPIVRQANENSVLCIANHQRILRFLLAKMQEKHPDLLTSTTLGDLGVGDFQADNLVNLSTKIIDVLRILKKTRVPCIAIVDDDGYFVDAFTRSDVRFIAMENLYDKVEMSATEALDSHIVGTCECFGI